MKAVALLVTLLSGLAFAQSPTNHGTAPSGSPDGSHIAFVSDRAGNSQVFVIKADGSHERQVTTSPEAKNAPRWIDRHTIIFSVTQSDDSHIFLINQNGKKQHEIAHVPGRNPALAPDGQHVISMVGPWLSTKFILSGLHNEDPHQLTDGTSTTWNAVWSPDGKQIAYTRRDDNWLNVWVMNADGSSPTQVSHVSHDEGQVQVPAWSPDGKRLAVQVNGGPKDKRTAHIWIIDPATGAAQKLAAHDQPYFDETPAWFPDGKRIAFQSNRTGRMEIWTMNIDGTDQRQVTK